MSGKSIELVKKALLLFIQSLPEKSYFQLIGFGSDFKKYNKEPVIYNKENVDNIINIINGLDADLGGTNISGPLKEIFNDSCYSKINLSRNIFLLTDGQVFDRESCINLITTNSSKFRIHSLGIGNDFDKILIEQCGKLGKGTSSFVQEIEKINSVVIDVLNKSLRPYITDIKFEFENYKEEIASNIISCNPTDNFTYQNEIMNYSFILPGNKDLSQLKIKIIGKDPINLIEAYVNFDNILKMEDGEEMSKMIVGKALKNNEELTKDEAKEIKFAKKYQILSKNTSLFAEIINEESQQSKLIKIELNESKAKEDDYDYNYLGSSNLYSHSYALKSSAKTRSHKDYCLSSNYLVKCCAAAPRSKAKKSLGFFKSSKKRDSGDDFLGSIKNKVFGLFSSKESSNKNSTSKKVESESLNHAITESSEKIKISPKKNYNMDIGENDEEESPKINLNNNKIDDNTRLIMSQDIIEGSWNENDETKKLIGIITSEKFDKIKNKIIALNKGANENKIIYTIIVIYYLKTKCIDKLSEYRLVINKADKFLKKNGINYDDVVSNI